MTRVKICGITNLQDGQLAVQAGADLLGFVFYAKSPRCVAPHQVRDIVAPLRDQPRAANVHYVGVFVDHDPAAIAQTLEFCGLDYAQLHGAEPPETSIFLLEKGFGAIKAFRIRDAPPLAELQRYRATAYLLDTYVRGQPGGTGQRFDWTLALPAKQCGPILLAGGLTPDNVAQAISSVQPWGVDVSSGVELEPGTKDPQKLRRFIAAAKAVNDRGNGQ